MKKFTLIDRMEVTDNRHRLYCGWASSKMAYVTGEVIGKYEPIETLYEYKLSIRAEYNFSCLPNEFSQGLQNAQQGMVRHLYKPIFGITDQIRAAVYKRDEKEILRLCDEIEREAGVIK